MKTKGLISNFGQGDHTFVSRDIVLNFSVGDDLDQDAVSWMERMRSRCRKHSLLCHQVYNLYQLKHMV